MGYVATVLATVLPMGFAMGSLLQWRTPWGISWKNSMDRAIRAIVTRQDKVHGSTRCVCHGPWGMRWGMPWRAPWRSHGIHHGSVRGVNNDAHRT